MIKLNQEQIEKIKKANSIEELETKIKEHNIELSKERLSSLYNMYCVNNAELSEEELDNVTGGACYSKGVTSPGGITHEYVIVTAYNICPAGPTLCMNCDECFNVKGIFYCALRWKGHDTLVSYKDIKDRIDKGERFVFIGKDTNDTSTWHTFIDD